MVRFAVVLFAALLGSSLSALPVAFVKPARLFDLCVRAPYDPAPMPRAVYPAAVEITKTGPVLDQGNLGSCAPNAAASMLVHAGAVQPSRLYIYYETRARQDDTKQDTGVYLKVMARAITESGFPPETEWPYQIDLFRKRPTWQVYRAAEPNVGAKFRDASDVKAELAAGRPVLVGIRWYLAFEDELPTTTGDMPKTETTDEFLGYHAVLLVGYNDRRGRWVFKNSYSTKWGDEGYGTLPYNQRLYDPIVLDSLK